MKQHSEKSKHQGFSAHLSQSLTGHETDPKADTDTEKDTERSQQPELLTSESYISSSSKRAVQSPKKAHVKMTYLQLLGLLMKRFGL